METLRVVQIELEKFFLKSKICSNLKRQESKTARLTPRIFIFGTKISGEISANFWGKLSPSSVYVIEKEELQVKITRKEIRRMILEQAQLPQGPFLVMVVDNNYGEVVEVFITKVLPSRDWWHAANGGAYTGEYVVNILDMSKKHTDNDIGLPSGRIVFQGPIDEIKDPD